MNLRGLSYCAGLYEGEGGTYLSYSPTYHSCTVRLMINMTDLEPLEKFKNNIGFGSITGPIKHNRNTAKNNYKPHYTFQTTGYEKMQAICCMLWSELSPRRKSQISNALTGCLEFKKSPKYTLIERKEIINALNYATNEDVAEAYMLPLDYIKYLERRRV